MVSLRSKSWLFWNGFILPSCFIDKQSQLGVNLSIWTHCFLAFYQYLRNPNPLWFLILYVWYVYFLCEIFILFLWFWNFAVMWLGVDLFSSMVPGTQQTFSFRKLISFSSGKFGRNISLLSFSSPSFLPLPQPLVSCGTSWTDALILKNFSLPYFYIFDFFCLF